MAVRFAALFLLPLITGCLVQVSPRATNPQKSRTTSPAFALTATVRGAEQVVLTASNISCPNFNSLFWLPDGPPRAYRDMGGHLRLLVPHLLTYALVGSTLDNVQLDCSTRVSASAANPVATAFDDFTWPWSPYHLADGRVFTINHQELHPNAHPSIYPSATGAEWYPALTLGVSSDGGVTFQAPSTNVADYLVARPNGPPLMGRITGGYSDPSNIMQNPKDGAYYMMVMWKAVDSAEPIDCLARAEDPANPDDWRVWDGRDFTIDMRTGAACPQQLPIGLNDHFAPGSLTWSASQERAIYTTFGQRNGSDGFYAFIAQNDMLTKWSLPSVLYSVAIPWHAQPPPTVAAYPSLLDDTGQPLNLDRMTDEPYLYFVRWNVSEVATRRQIVRVPLSLSWLRRQ